MTILIIGLGSIAQKHIHVLRVIDSSVTIYALRSSKTASTQKDVINLYSWEELDGIDFDFALISSPSVNHLNDIKKVSALGIPMMVEKPLLVNTDQIKRFNEEISEEALIYVACNFRFHPVILFLKQYLGDNPLKINEVNSYCGSYLPDWRPDSDYKKVYSANEKLGGGVHLDLIHEPDYIIYLFGTPNNVVSKYRKTSHLDIDSVDSSMSIFEYDEFQAQITLNYFRRDAKRTLEIVLEEKTIIADFIASEVLDLKSKSLLFKEDNPSIYTTYKAQMQYFISCLKEGIRPMNSASEAIEVLKYTL